MNTATWRIAPGSWSSGKKLPPTSAKKGAARIDPADKDVEVEGPAGPRTIPSDAERAIYGWFEKHQSVMADQGTFVVTLGRDTIAAERFKQHFAEQNATEERRRPAADLAVERLVGRRRRPAPSRPRPARSSHRRLQLVAAAVAVAADLAQVAAG